jgi:hypothetical protein
MNSSYMCFQESCEPVIERWVVVFNATFNNISVISWRSILLVEETGVLGENHSLSQVIDKLYHIMLYRHEWGSNSQF